MDRSGCLGFQFKTVAFAWVKVNRQDYSLFTGLGWWTRANVELCLLATRGHPRRQDNTVHQVVMSRIEGHSKKPDEVRHRIERLMGDVPRVELCARQYSPGWDVWGNQVSSSIDIDGWGDFDTFLSDYTSNLR